MDIEFTDRYGGQCPSWLTACHGQCEATGWIPTLDDSPWIRCPDCHGTGRVSLVIGVSRIPRWIWRGFAFLPWALQKDVNPPSWNLMRRLRCAVWAAWGADIAALARDMAKPVWRI